MHSCIPFMSVYHILNEQDTGETQTPACKLHRILRGKLGGPKTKTTSKNVTQTIARKFRENTK